MSNVGGVGKPQGAVQLWPSSTGPSAPVSPSNVPASAPQDGLLPPQAPNALAPALAAGGIAAAPNALGLNVPGPGEPNPEKQKLMENLLAGHGLEQEAGELRSRLPPDQKQLKVPAGEGAVEAWKKAARELLGPGDKGALEDFLKDSGGALGRLSAALGGKGDAKAKAALEAAKALAQKQPGAKVELVALAPDAAKALAKEGKVDGGVDGELALRITPANGQGAKAYLVDDRGAAREVPLGPGDYVARADAGSLLRGGKPGAQVDSEVSILGAVKTEKQYRLFDQHASALAAPLFMQHVALRGDAARELSGTDLDNEIATMMMLAPDNAAAATKEGELLHGPAAQKIVAPIAAQIRKTVEDDGGGPVKVASLPVMLNTKEHGPIQLPLFRVETKKGERYVDNTGRYYASFKDWKENNKLPPGRMTFAEGGHLALGKDQKPKLKTENTPLTVDSLGERIKQGADLAAMVGGFALLGAAVIGTGGLALPVAGIGLAAYGAYRSGENLLDRRAHRQSLSLLNPEARMDWLNLGASVLAPAFLGKMISGMRAGVTATPEFSKSFARLAVASQYADSFAIVNQAQYLGAHWDELDLKTKLMMGGQIAAWGGMLGLQSRQLGGVRNLYSVAGMRQRMVDQVQTSASVPTVNGGKERWGDVQIEDVQPTLDAGRFPIQISHGESVPVKATLFPAGHDQIAAQVRWKQDPTHPGADGVEYAAPMVPGENHTFTGSFKPPAIGRWKYAVESWVDVYRTFASGLVKKSDAGQDLRVPLLDGANLLAEAASRAPRHSTDVQLLNDAAALVREKAAGSPHEAMAVLLDDAVVNAATRHPDLRAASRTQDFEVFINRPHAQFRSTFEFFPRSVNNDGKPATLYDAADKMLPRVKEMGFDTVYLPPVHPIGKTARKGADNAPVAREGEPGSPWAIGSAEGGHMTIHPELGGMDAFKYFMAKAKDLGLEVQMDMVWQFSPDHPMVKAHPEWFKADADGKLVPAENPPKRYEDVTNPDWNSSPARKQFEDYFRKTTEFWIDHGVKSFRVDNPHTKPLPFWSSLIRGVQTKHPEVMFLSEAFTFPEQQLALSKAGFNTSHSYFMWRDSPQELNEFFTQADQLAADGSMKLETWPTTPDNLTPFLADGGLPAHVIRAAEAALNSPRYGIMHGYQYGKANWAPNMREMGNNPKYEHEVLSGDPVLEPFLADLNRIRRENPALQRDGNLEVLDAGNANVSFRGKRTPDGSNNVFWAISGNPHGTESARLTLPLEKLGISGDQPFRVKNLLTGESFRWTGAQHEWTLTPDNPVGIFQVLPAPKVKAAAPQAAAGYQLRHGPQGFAGTQVETASGRAMLPDARVEAGKPLTVRYDRPDVREVELFYRVDGGEVRSTRLAPGEEATLPVPLDAHGSVDYWFSVQPKDGEVFLDRGPRGPYRAEIIPAQGSTLRFGRDWSVDASEPIKAGEALHLAYSPERILSQLKDPDLSLWPKLAKAKAFVAFDDGTPLEVPITLNAIAEGSARLPTFKGAVRVPESARNVRVWVQGEDPSGFAYDSNLGRDYAFEVSQAESAGGASGSRGVDWVAAARAGGAKGAKDAATGIDLAKLGDFMSDRRWYAGKSKTPTEVKIADSVEYAIPGDARWFNTVVKVKFQDGTSDAYQVPVKVNQDGSVEDALSSDAFVQAFVQQMRQGLTSKDPTVAMREGQQRFVRTAATDDFLSRLSETPKIRHLGAEQSNTTVLVDGIGALKFVRRLDGSKETVNPEYELSNVMTSKGSDVAPRLFGAAVMEGEHPGVSAFMHEAVPGAKDAWENITAQLEALPKNQPLPKALLDSIEQLGARTAQMADALYVKQGPDAVRTEPATPALLAQWSEKLLKEIDANVASVLPRYPELAPIIPKLRARAQELAGLSASGVLVQRIHGDYHLGQVLSDENGKWVVVDFEGEPARALVERRSKDSPLRDAAGMLRSLDYAGATSGRSAAEVRSLREAFQKGFDAQSANSPFIPKGELGRKLLQLKELEKAVYEFAYETGFRPHFTHIPMAKLLEVAGMEPDAALSAATSAVARERHEAVWNRDYPSALSADDLHLFKEGTLEDTHRLLGAHEQELDGVKGTSFRVWAPNAKSISVVTDANGWNPATSKMTRRDGGVWEGFVPTAKAGDVYKYFLHDAQGNYVYKADPAAAWAEVPPLTASKIAPPDEHVWSDGEWMKARATRDAYNTPTSIYEVHLGSWDRKPDGTPMNFEELAEPLAKYALDNGFSHVEVMPPMLAPFSGSWGYQQTGPYAPNPVLGTPAQFAKFVDVMHQKGVGVIVDWVPAHFPKDAHGPAHFDGTNPFVPEDPLLATIPDWGTYQYDFSRPEVRSFLQGSLFNLLKRYHVDGFRTDAVSAMVYKDYSRDQWNPNWGPDEVPNLNYPAIRFLQDLNQRVRAFDPGVLRIAEESTAFDVTNPVDKGGLDFNYKWNMGWMNDTLRFFETPFEYRPQSLDTLTNTGLWQFAQKHISALSHDEVVHLKKSLLEKMPGDDWQKHAGVRALFGWMTALPSPSHIFQGMEFGQRTEWNHDARLPWEQAEAPLAQGLMRAQREMNFLKQREPALARYADEGRYEFVSADHDNGIVAVRRKGETPDQDVLFVMNTLPVAHQGYRVGVKQPGRYEEVLNTDAAEFGGSGVKNSPELKASRADDGLHGQEHALALTLPPLATVALRPRANG